MNVKFWCMQNNNNLKYINANYNMNGANDINKHMEGPNSFLREVLSK